MIDARFKVVGLRDGTVVVSWPHGDRVIEGRFGGDGALQSDKLISHPAVVSANYRANKLRFVDPARPTYASILSIVRGQWRAILAEAERQRAEAVERIARLKYKAECELFVERVGIFSAMAAARVAMHLAEGRDLESLKLEIRAHLEEWGAGD